MEVAGELMEKYCMRPCARRGESGDGIAGRKACGGLELYVDVASIAVRMERIRDRLNRCAWQGRTVLRWICD